MKWNWVLSANYMGSWITTEGYAEVVISDGEFEASLFISNDTPRYLRVYGEFNEDGFVDATGVPEDTTVPTYSFVGLYNKSNIEQSVIQTLTLTDGGTMLGIAVNDTNT